MRRALLPLWLALVGLVACTEAPGPEARITAVVEGLADAVEQRDLRRAAAFLDPGYRDDRHRDKSMALRSLMAYLRLHHSVHLFSLIREIRVHASGDSADAVIYVAMAGVPVESLEVLRTLKADLYRFDVGLTRNDDDWLIVRSGWRRAELPAP